MNIQEVFKEQMGYMMQESNLAREIYHNLGKLGTEEGQIDFLCASVRIILEMNKNIESKVVDLVSNSNAAAIHGPVVIVVGGGNVQEVYGDCDYVIADYDNDEDVAEKIHLDAIGRMRPAQEIKYIVGGDDNDSE